VRVTICVQETIGATLHESVTRPAFKDPYTIELEHLHQDSFPVS
jgi:hypothetical protein